MLSIRGLTSHCPLLEFNLEEVFSPLLGISALSFFLSSWFELRIRIILMMCIRIIPFSMRIFILINFICVRMSIGGSRYPFNAPQHLYTLFFCNHRQTSATPQRMSNMFDLLHTHFIIRITTLRMLILINQKY